MYGVLVHACIPEAFTVVCYFFRPSEAELNKHQVQDDGYIPLVDNNIRIPTALDLDVIRGVCPYSGDRTEFQVQQAQCAPMKEVPETIRNYCR